MFDRLKKLFDPQRPAPPDSELERLAETVSILQENYLASLRHVLEETREKESLPISVENMVVLPDPRGFPQNYYRFDIVIEGPVTQGTASRRSKSIRPFATRSRPISSCPVCK